MYYRVRAAFAALILAAAISTASYAQTPTVTPAPTAVMVEGECKTWDEAAQAFVGCFRLYLAAVIKREYFSTTQYSLEGDKER